VDQLAAIERPDLVAEGYRVLLLSSFSRGNPNRVCKTGTLCLGRQRNHDNSTQLGEIIDLENHGGAAASLLVIALRLAKIDQPHFATLSGVHG
jgi:hypothetical protein